jgi:hypothetical protein
MIPTIDIEVEKIAYFYDEFYIGESDITQLVTMTEEGQGSQALDVFVSEFIQTPAQKYQDTVVHYLTQAEQGIFDDNTSSKVLRNIALLSASLTVLLTSNFEKYLRRVESPAVLGGIDTPIKSSIIEEVLAKYEQSIQGAMTQTQSFVLNGIRSIQRDMIAYNAAMTGVPNFESLIGAFKSEMKIKYPDIYNAIKNGNVLATRKFGLEEESVRHYKLGYYADMTTRTVMSEAGRNAVEYLARVSGENVVEFVWLDSRNVKKDREICQTILNTLVGGKSLLALDTETARKYGIMTIEEARSTPDHAFGPNCRHGLQRLDSSFLKLLAEKK